MDENNEATPPPSYDTLDREQLVRVAETNRMALVLLSVACHRASTMHPGVQTLILKSLDVDRSVMSRNVEQCTALGCKADEQTVNDAATAAEGMVCNNVFRSYLRAHDFLTDPLEMQDQLPALAAAVSYSDFLLLVISSAHTWTHNAMRYGPAWAQDHMVELHDALKAAIDTPASKVPKKAD